MIRIRSLEGREIRSFWWTHVRLPLLVGALLAVLLAAMPIDLVVARSLFFDMQAGVWRGAELWWTNGLLHDGGRWAVRLVVLAALVVWVAGDRVVRWQPWRRPAAYLALAIMLSTLLVGLLKSVTNVDCPWDLSVFGGARPYVALLADRPDGLPRAACFPSAHASSGYALMSLYFVALERSRRWARAGLSTGLVTGLVFGLAQQSRGAHFLSHDLASVFLVWLTCLTLYTAGFGRRLYGEEAPAWSPGHLSPG